MAVSGVASSEERRMKLVINRAFGILAIDGFFENCLEPSLGPNELV